MRKALDVGASGFISKSGKAEVMLSALRLILAGGIYVPPDMLKPYTDTDPRTREIAATSSGATDSQTPVLTARQRQVLEKLRQGKFPIEHELDLHGLTVEHARQELQSFIGECEAIGIRHAIIIHGKGFRSKDKPVIKPMVNRWLREVDNVLAFHSAQPRDGGSGAVYVLFRKS